MKFTDKAANDLREMRDLYRNNNKQNFLANDLLDSDYLKIMKILVANKQVKYMRLFTKGCYTVETMCNIIFSNRNREVTL